MASSAFAAYGWSAVPRDTSEFIAKTSASNTRPIHASKIALPSGNISKKTLQYAQEHLPNQLLNHSLRVYLFGIAMATQHFPDLLDMPHFSETYFAACLLHDVGTTEENMTSTKMSFEFHGAMVAMAVLRGFDAEKDLVEQVGETIIRHQDVGTTGNCSAVTALIFLSTLLDNAGANPQLVHKDTIASVVEAYPRNKWTSCFANTIRRELELKPWAHSSHIEDFTGQIESNQLMAEYD